MRFVPLQHYVSARRGLNHYQKQFIQLKRVKDKSYWDQHWEKKQSYADGYKDGHEKGCNDTRGDVVFAFGGVASLAACTFVMLDLFPRIY